LSYVGAQIPEKQLKSETHYTRASFDRQEPLDFMLLERGESLSVYSDDVNGFV